MLAPAQPRWSAGSVQGSAIRDACDCSWWLFPWMSAGARRYPISLSIPPGLLMSQAKQLLAVSRGGTEQQVISLPLLLPMLLPTEPVPGELRPRFPLG